MSNVRKVYDDGEMVVHEVTIPDVRSFLDRNLSPLGKMDCYTHRESGDYDCSRCKASGCAQHPVRQRARAAQEKRRRTEQRLQRQHQRGWR